MKITLSPQRRDDTLTVFKVGDALVLNGEVLDFGPLPEGGTLPFGSVNNPWVASDVNRINGQIEVSIILPCAAGASPSACFPAPIITTQDGPVELPV